MGVDGRLRDMNDVSSLDAEQVTTDLRSQDPVRIARALGALDEAWRRRDFVPLPFLEPSCLEAFVEGVPDDIVEKYLSVVAHYPDFDPTPSGAKVRQSLLEVMVRYGQREEIIHSVVLFFRIDDYPRISIPDALDYLGQRGVESEEELHTVERFVAWLLDSHERRDLIVDQLWSWALSDTLPEVIEAVLPMLDHAERARIDEAREEA